ncbi:MFS transporter, partial [Klebsiella pneumoniae]
LSDVYSLLLLISAVAGLGRGGIHYVPGNTYTYSADADEAITGQRRAGIFPGSMTLTPQASQAGAVLPRGRTRQVSRVVAGLKIKPEWFSHTFLLFLSVGHLLVLAYGFLVSLRFIFNLHTHSVLCTAPLRMRELVSAQ